MRHPTPGISENARKKVNTLKDIKLKNFKSIVTIFFINKNSIFHLCPIVARFLKIVLSWRLEKMILKGREFRGGSDE